MPNFTGVSWRVWTSRDPGAAPSPTQRGWSLWIRRRADSKGAARVRAPLSRPHSPSRGMVAEEACGGGVGDRGAAGQLLRKLDCEGPAEAPQEWAGPATLGLMSAPPRPR